MALTKSESLGGGTPRLADRLLRKQCAKSSKPIDATTLYATGSRSSALTGAQNDRWRPCSRRESCPVCGRPNGKCRIKGDFVHCWKGDSYAPPDISIGATIAIHGNRWRKLADDCGFAKNSVCFVSVSQRTPYSPHVGKVRSGCLSRSDKSRDLVTRFLGQVDKAMSVSEFANCEPATLSQAFILIDKVYSLTQELLPVFKKIALSSLSVRQLMPLVHEAVKDIQYQKSDADMFRRVMLGDPLLNGWIE